MEESFVIKKLIDVDKELHSLIKVLKTQSKQCNLSLSEIRDLFSRSSIEDIDSTELIRQMREKEY